MVPYSLFTLAFGGSLVPRLNLIIDLVCKRYFADKSAADPTYVFSPVIPGADNPQCRLDPDVQASVAAFTLVISVLTGTLSSLTAPKLGSLSDRYGRKRLIVISSFGAIVGEVITILAAKYPDVVHYRWMLVGAFFDGLTGSFTAGSVLSHAYTSDCTPPSKRSVAIGYLHACLFTGLAFGPLLAGYFVEWTGSLLSIFYIALGCHIFFILFMFFVAPESLSTKRQMLAREKYAAEMAEPVPTPRWVAYIASRVAFGHHFENAMRSMRTANPLAPLNILFPKGAANTRVRRNLITLALIDMGLLGAAMSAGTVTVLYTEYMFGWKNLDASRFVSLVSMVRVVVLMGIFPVINYIFRTLPNERRRRAEGGGPRIEKNSGADELDVWVLRSALLSDVIGATGYIFARTGGLFVLAAIVTAFGGMGSATVQAALSKHVPAERVGQLLGAIGLLHSLARVISPIIFNGLYAATVSTFPQAFFMLLAGLFLAGLVASFLVKPHLYVEEDEHEEEPPSQGSTAVRQDTLEDEELLPGLTP
ncbi:major facilitator superfamily domain-containing protein [Echria macrotheca]|uniref:Major facilitator superfamily domain-containing protein n=1 Tax=Echria macrotheca TaxID=438768 RepID=A0AAJ0FDI5_9PEZI|nr:major facilitator superfamily domain-containing protein [Echria macrotheca]